MVEAVQADVQVPHAATLVILLVTMLQQIQVMVARDHHVVLHARLTVKTLPIIPVDVQALHVALHARLTAETLPIIPVDVRALHVRDSVRVDVLQPVPKLVQVIVPESVAMDVPVTVEVVVKTPVQEVADDNVVFLVVVHVAENALPAVRHNASILRKAVAEAVAPAVAI